MNISVLCTNYEAKIYVVIHIAIVQKLVYNVVTKPKTKIYGGNQNEN